MASKVSIISLALLLLAGPSCNLFESVEEEPPSLEPTSLTAISSPDRLVAQSSVDAAIPDWSDFHTAWWIEWEGTRPARVVVERFRRDECFVRARYEHLGQGELHQKSVEIRSSKEEGEPVQSEDLFFSRVVEEIESGRKDWFHRRDVAGKLFYAYDRIEPELENAPLVEVMIRVIYENEPCTLKAVVRTREVPSKEMPAGVSESLRPALQ